GSRAVQVAALRLPRGGGTAGRRDRAALPRRHACDARPVGRTPRPPRLLLREELRRASRCQDVRRMRVRGGALSGELLLALDNGTQSVRALVFDLRGNLVASSRVPLVPYVSPRPGWAEQDPEYFWSSLCRATRSLFAESSIPKDALKGVALTTQRGTIFHVDATGRALRPAIVWLDQRRARSVPRLGPLYGSVFKLARLSETIGYVQREAEANWVLEHQPEVAK